MPKDGLEISIATISPVLIICSIRALALTLPGIIGLEQKRGMTTTLFSLINLPLLIT